LRRSIEGADPELAAELADVSTLDELVGRIQEDVVLMRREAADANAATATAFYLNVCFPTGWCPRCMLGLRFAQIHGPVPALDDFAAGRGAWGRYLFDVQRGATVRFVWTITADDALDRRRCGRGLHDDAARTSWADAGAAYFRIERQVLVPLTATVGMFLIRIYRQNVASLEPAERERLRQSMDAMDPKLAAYKGFAGHEKDIRRLLA
jgi:dimethylamine monooxygenase subunit A